MGEYELYHASTRKHKYIKKIGNRYFYTQEELRAYYGKDDIQKDDIQKDVIVKDKIVKDVKTKDSEYKKNTPSRNSAAVSEAQRRGERQTSIIRARQTVDSYQDRGRSRTEQLKKSNTDYRSPKKTYRKRQQIEIQRKKNNIEFLKSHGVDTTEHEADLKRAEDDYNRDKKRKKAAKRTLKNMKKQAARGKKALDKIYTKATTPNITVTYDEAKLK